MHELLARAQANGTPIIEGDRAVFIWQGTTAPALFTDTTGWNDEQALTLTQVAPELWSYSLPLLPDAYIEYVFMDADIRVRDPFNKRVVTNGFGKMNHWFDMPEARHTPFAYRNRNVAHGLLTEHKISGGMTMVGEQRPVYLYHPPTNAPVPLVVVLDGKDFATRAKLPNIVDNLIAQKRIRPIALAMPQNAGQARFVEYLCSDSTLAFLTRDVLALSEQHLHLLPLEENPGAYGILGASLGGTMALYSGLRLPQIFGKVMSLSGGFGFTIDGEETVIYDLVRHYERRPVNIWMNVGRYEGLLHVNRKMRALLDEKGYAPTYREYSGGHNYTAWRDEVVFALEAQFG